MSELTWIVLATLTAYRLAYMLVNDDGPFDAFAWLRDKIGVDRQETWVQRGFGCPGCISFWLSLGGAITIANSYPTNAIGFLTLWFGMAGAALFLLVKSR
jgi:hypothetical protein